MVPPVSVSAYLIALSLGAATPAKPAKSKDAQPEQNLAELYDMLGGAGFETKKPDWLKADTHGR